jgi:hypothetical protein
MGEEGNGERKRRKEIAGDRANMRKESEEKVESKGNKIQSAKGR